MPTRTHWNDGNFTPSDYVRNTGNPVDVDLGEHDLALKEINQYATSEYDGPTLGPELLDDTGWTSTGWTGSWSTGWVNAGGTTLSRPVSLTAGKTYFLQIDSEFDLTSLSIGGYSEGAKAGVYSHPIFFTAINSNDLIIVMNFVFLPVFITLKEVVSERQPIYSLSNSANTKIYEIYSDNLNNTFIGVNSGIKNVTGYNNLCFGNNTLLKNTTGYNNTAIGNNALYNNLYGYSNLAFGASCLFLNTAGQDNVAIGSNALYRNTTGGINLAIGSTVLFNNTTGQRNIAFGTLSLGENTTGGDNIAIGYNAGRYYGVFSNNLNSAYSVFIGINTKALAANQINEVVIGYQAKGNGSNTVTLGDTSITGTYLRGDIYPVDGKNLILGTTTGMKIGTATTQKLGFFNSVPVVQQAATTDLGVTLSNLGLRAAGIAYPITTSGALSLTGGGTISGTISLGTASTQVITNISRMVFRTAASDPQHATPASRPAGTVGEIVYYTGKMYFCTNSATPTWEKFTST